MIVNPHHELILLAAEMAQGTGLPSEFPEDRGFCKTTPVKERRRIIAELELSRQTARVWAQRVRAAADLLAAENAALRARLAEAEAEIARYNAESRQRQARLAEAERDAARIEWLASNPRGGQIVVDGKTQDCVFWGISGHPRATLRDAIDAARATDSAGEKP